MLNVGFGWDRPLGLLEGVPPIKDCQAEAAGADFPQIRHFGVAHRLALASQGAPTVLYNGMIAPLQPYAIRGVIWYQGEANANQAELYRRIFPNLVADWRRSWTQRDFPFLYVQIAPMNPMPPEIREAQRLSLARGPTSPKAIPSTRPDSPPRPLPPIPSSRAMAPASVPVALNRIFPSPA